MPDTLHSAPSVGFSSHEDGDFGWRACYDTKRNLAFEFHTYTGEVRWLPPQSVGFVVEGTRPLPVETKATSERDDAQLAQSSGAPPAYEFPGAAPECWSPYYPRMVMVPSGLLELQQQEHHQQAGIDHGDPQLCAYNRFPVAWDFGAGVVARVEEDVGRVKSTLVRSPGRRVLPPTWESAIQDHSPFLEMHPVAVLASVESVDDANEPLGGGESVDTAAESTTSERPPVLTTDTTESSAPLPPAPPSVRFSSSAGYDSRRCSADAVRGVWCYPQWAPGVMVPVWMQLPPAPAMHFYYSAGLARA